MPNQVAPNFPTECGERGAMPILNLASSAASVPVVCFAAEISDYSNNSDNFGSFIEHLPSCVSFCLPLELLKMLFNSSQEDSPDVQA